MGVKRWTATKDTTITNAFKANLTDRGTLGNMGASDILEAFVIAAQASSASLESSRILVDFPVTQIATDRTAGLIPASGSVSFFLKLSNAFHGETTPKDFDLVVEPLSRSWTEGYGLDMEQYLDLGSANWLSASSGVSWTTGGGDFLSSPVSTASFDNGVEGLEVDITVLVESWLSGTIPSNGIGVRFPDASESGSTSFFTKRFFGRRSEHFYKRPWIEARYNSSIKDNRNNFYISSSLVPAEDNLRTLFLYNRTPKGLRNIPAVGTGPIYMSLFSGVTYPFGPELLLHNSLLSVTGGAVDTGIYTASVALNTTATTVFDVWHNNLTGSSRIEYFTGSAIQVLSYSVVDQFEVGNHVVNITNMKPRYSTTERARFRTFTRPKDWSPTVYTMAVADIENTTIEDAYYRVFRVIDGLEVIPYGTGSNQHTLLSYDKDGNYFDLDMSILEPDYQYGIGLAFKLEDKIYEQNEVFKFRVE